jgi:hypothetical protein
MVGLKEQVNMTHMIVCNEEIRLLIGKGISRTAKYVPEVGQDIVLTVAVAVGATFITVEPLQENIKVGTVLQFRNALGALLGSVTVSVQPERDATRINIAPAATVAIAVFAVAQTVGVEQTLTIGTAVTAGARSITLATALTDWIEKGRPITFASGIEVICKTRAEIGATTISIDPAPVAIAVGDTAAIANYLEVLSINQLDDSSSANTLNERNFRSGSGTGKSVTSYSDTVTIGGNYIIGDFALFRLYKNKQDAKMRGLINHAIIIEPDSGQDLRAVVWLGQHGNTRPNDQTKKISATLEVDGILGETLVPRRIFD